MKLSDVDEIHKAGLITEDQRRAIVAHFELDRESNKLLAILSIIGAVLVSAGIILLIASNWDAIPRLVKLVGGLALLGGAHAGGWFVGRTGRHPRVADALHLIGSVMFLANIALVGQIYHLSSRTPNAILLWLLGIAPLAWILRSKAQHILTLGVLALWLGLELNERDSLLYFGGEARQMMFYVIVGVALSGLGMLLQRSRVPEFGPSTEGFGILMLLDRVVSARAQAVLQLQQGHPIGAGSFAPSARRSRRSCSSPALSNPGSFPTGSGDGHGGRLRPVCSASRGSG